MKPLHRFRLKGPEGYFFKVLIFKDKEDMYIWFTKNNGQGDLDFAGIVMPYEAILKEERMKDIGTVLLCKDRLGSGLIAHEMGHCAFWYDRLINGNTKAEYGEEIGESEERVLYLLSSFVKDLVNKIYSLKL